MTVDIINDNQRQTIVTTVDHDCSESCSAAADHAVLQCQDCVIRELRVLWSWSERRSRDLLVSVVSAPVTAHVPAGAGCECRISWDTPLPGHWAAAFFPHFFLHFSSPHQHTDSSTGGYQRVITSSRGADDECCSGVMLGEAVIDWHCLNTSQHTTQ